MDSGYTYIPCPWGKLRAEYEDGAITALRWAGSETGEGCPGNTLTDLVASELAEYFAGSRQTFSFPMELRGTEFQRKVWNALLTIPYGETRTYGQIAAQIGSPKASRAVGMANHRNPIMIAVPCHRVVGAKGQLTGYAYGLDIKAQLLELEISSPLQPSQKIV